MTTAFKLFTFVIATIALLSIGNAMDLSISININTLTFLIAVFTLLLVIAAIIRMTYYCDAIIRNQHVMVESLNFITTQGHELKNITHNKEHQ